MAVASMALAHCSRPTVIVLQPEAEQIFASIYSSYSGEIHRYCRRMVRNEDTALDMSQETFLAAWNALPDFDGENPRGWLYRIAHNVCLMHLMYLGRRPEVSLESETDEANEFVAHDWALESVVLRLSADKLMHGMSEQKSTCLRLRLAGLQLQEISECMGRVAVSTVSSWLYSAQDQMRRELERPST